MADTLEAWLATQRGAENFKNESPKFQLFFREKFAEALALKENSGGTMDINEAMTEVLIRVWENLEGNVADSTEAEVPDGSEKPVR